MKCKDTSQSPSSIQISTFFPLLRRSNAPDPIKHPSASDEPGSGMAVRLLRVMK
jgi:hypothetical protein